MTGWSAALLVALSVLLQPRPASASTGGERKGAPNSILGISTACSAESLNVTVRMRQPFRGILYSRGFPLECSTATDQHHKLLDFLKRRELQDPAKAAKKDAVDAGDPRTNEVPLQPSKEATLSLPASECGIRVVPSKDGDGLWLQTSVVVQLDRHLQQAADQTRSVSCHLSAKDSSVLMRSPSVRLVQPISSHPQEAPHAKPHGQRTGRQHVDDIPSADFADDNSVIGWERARAVMEIMGSAANRDPGVLAVGEEVALVVTSHLPVGVGSRVTDCFAHDGAGEGMERLSDSRGCPTDRLILPQLREVRRPTTATTQDDAPPPSTSASSSGHPGHPYRKRKKRTLLNSGLQIHVSAAKFAAFKFPDRSRLHLRCQLQLCRGSCLQDECLLEKGNASRQDRRMKKGEPGEVLGRLQVFNSVEVLAPGIEADDRLRLDELTAASGPPVVTPGEKTFCLSPPKMALAFATLGSIFLCAVAVALYTLLRGSKTAVSRSPGRLPRAFLRRHLLRLREGSSASLGERNVLVRVQDSPFHSSTPSPTPTTTAPILGPSLWQEKLFH